MKITIIIENEDGELIQQSKCLSVESAVQELYRFERNAEQEKLQDIINDSVK